MNSNKKTALKLWVRVILLIFIITIFSLGIVLTIKEFISKPVNRETIYSYNIDSSMDYSVELFDNSFIEDKFLGMGKTYMSDLVKLIKANYHYKLLGSNGSKLYYNYTITATINGTYKLNNEYTDSKVWTKSYVLYDSGDIESNSNHIIIDDSIDIDFHYYDNEVAAFRKELKLPINASLDVILDLKVSGIVDDNKYSDSRIYIMKIPLNQQAFNITSSITPESDDSKVYNLYKIVNNESINYGRVVSGCFLVISSTLLFIILFKKIFVFKKKDYYAIKKDKILKEYGEVIVEVAEPIIDEDFNVILIKNFSEMIDLEEELRIPIMFYDYITEKKGEFVIMQNNCIYKFTLTNEND